MTGAEEVLDFWFGELDETGMSGKDRENLWWSSGPDLDREIEQRFGALVERALAEDLEDWPDEPRFRLAKIILLDQFTRNIFRGSARAFAGDPSALELSKQGLDRGEDKRLSPAQRAFFYMPLEHSESLEDQDLSVAQFEALHREFADIPGAKLLKSYCDYAERHRDIIRRFGRYPHRNRALDRESTEAERAYLAGGGATFGQG